MRSTQIKDPCLLSTEKFNKNIDCVHYEQPKENDVFPSFVIAHYAGRVGVQWLYVAFFLIYNNTFLEPGFH